MSTPVPSHHVALVRQAEAEVVGGPPVTGRLYADSSATGGALSSQRITLRRGAAGATPHHHTGSSELFYVISGTAEMLTGERILTAGEGDLIVVPPGTVHAFAAAHGSDADLLIIITPGVERFEYFRQLQRIAAGQAPPESILRTQDLYDNHFDDSPAWQQALTARQHSGQIPMTTSRRLVSSGSPLEPEIGFSRAVRAGPCICVAGTAPIAEGGGTAAPGDVYGQSVRCLDIAEQALQEAGASLADVVRTRVMLTDIGQWRHAARAHAQRFAQVRPVTTFIEVSRFVDPEWLVEFELDAIVPD